MKDITLAIIQLSADLENNNTKGIVRFIDRIEAQYDNFLKQHKYDESEFKKEVREVLEDIFSRGELLDLAGKIPGNGEKTVIRGIEVEVHLPYVKKIYDLKAKYDITKYFYRYQDYFKNFVEKYKDRYDSEDKTTVYAWYYYILHYVHPKLNFNNDPDRKSVV